MNKTKKHKNLQKLKELGVEEWMFFNDDFKDFFNWFSGHITDENILTNDEVREYEYCDHDGVVFSKEDLQNEIKKIEVEFPVFTLTEFDVECLQLEVDYLTNWKNENNDIIKELNETTSSLFNQIDKNVTMIEKIKKSDVQIICQCNDAIQKLQDLQLVNQSKVVEANRLFAIDTLPPLFISQMGLQDYYKNCDVFINNLKIYMKSNFKMNDSLEISFNLEEEVESVQSGKEVFNIKKKFNKANEDLIRLEINLKGQRKIITNISTYVWRPITEMNMIKDTNELALKNEQMNQQMDVLINQLLEMSKQLVDLEIETAVYECNQFKLLHARQRLNNIKRLQEIVGMELLNLDCLWFLMRIEIMKIQTKHLFSPLVTFNLQTKMCQKRIDQMKMITQLKSTTVYDNFINNKYYSLLVLHFKDLNKLYETINISPIVIYEKLQWLITKQYDFLFQLKPYQSLINYTNQLKDLNSCIYRFVYDGPTSQPNLFDLQLLQDIFYAKRSLKNNDESIREIKSKYVQNYTEPSNSDSFWRSKQLFWIWFVTEPKMVLKAIKAVKETVNSRGIKSKPKMVTGIRRM